MAYPDFTPEELATEEWRPIVGFEEFYAVSNLGRVKTIQGRYRGRIHIGDMGRLKIKYRRVLLSAPIRRRLLVHRVVLAAFVGPCPEGHEVNHLDADPQNNRLANLEYCTHQDNQLHAVALGRWPIGARNNKTKLDEIKVREIVKLIANGLNNHRIAVQFGLDANSVKNIRLGISWRSVTGFPRPKKQLKPK